jgi:hypothetical protein
MTAPLVPGSLTYSSLGGGANGGREVELLSPENGPLCSGITRIAGIGGWSVEAEDALSLLLLRLGKLNIRENPEDPR